MYILTCAAVKCDYLHLNLMTELLKSIKTVLMDCLIKVKKPFSTDLVGHLQYNGSAKQLNYISGSPELNNSDKIVPLHETCLYCWKVKAIRWLTVGPTALKIKIYSYITIKCDVAQSDFSSHRFLQHFVAR